MNDELIVDSFAGGGGASLGITKALGRHPDIAINHDAAAIAMHAANHAEATPPPISRELILPSVGLRQASSRWFYSRDGSDIGLSIFRRHYSFKEYRDGRPRRLFVGPGEKVVLITKSCDALFVWRKFKSGDGQVGVNCAVFRNEGPQKSSGLILEAMKIAWERWPGERLYTYVNSRKVRSSNPGCCFKKAGWKKCGITKWNKLVIFEVNP